MDLNPLTIGETPEEYTENPDGSVEIIELSDDIVEDSEFEANLAEELPESDLNSMSYELCELIKKDRKSREKRDKQYEEGLRRTGLGDDAPGGADFDGASRVVHPVLVEACVDFSSRAIKELFPASGPVKTQVVGEHNPQKSERSARKARYMNWQLTTQIQEYRDELEQLLTQLPMGGSQFQKFWFDPDMNRVRSEFVPVDEILLPFAATNFYTAQRATHRQMITRFEYERRVKSGLYRDANIGYVDPNPDQSATSTANDKIEGKEDECYNEDGLRAVLEIYTWFSFEGDNLTAGDVAPYIITIDEHTEKVLAVYRNWEDDDVLRRKLDWFVEWKFVPWRGAYAIGLPHIIGGMSAAMTGALRALLDSAHINNAPSAIKLKGGRVSGQNKQVNITEITELDAPPGTDDIRKLVMPMPFNQPSPVLLALMDKLYELSRNVVSSAEDAIGQVGDRTPVGTTMALIEQGSAVYSAVHARLHESQKKALEILHRLDAKYLDEESVVQELGEQVVTRDDFTGTMDVIPVSDPTIFSEAQRFAQVQAVVQMAADQSVPWNKINVYRRALKQMRIEDPDSLLPAPKDPVTADFLTENFQALQGAPLKAVPVQDHMAHIQGHLAFVTSPLQIENPLVPPQALLGVLAHIGEHIQQYQQAALQPLGEQGALQLGPQVTALLVQQVGPVLQQVQQVQAQLQQRMPPPPMPPEVQASIQIAQMEVNRKTAVDQAQAQLRTQEFQQRAQLEQATLQLKQQVEQGQLAAAQQSAALEHSLEQAKLSLKSEYDNRSLALQNEIENLRQQVELMKNARDNAQKHHTEIMKNTDDNQTKVDIEYIRLGANNGNERSEPA